MMPAIFDQTTVEDCSSGKDRKTYDFRVSGSVLKFDGFLKVYEEGKDEKDEDDDELTNKLPSWTTGRRWSLQDA